MENYEDLGWDDSEYNFFMSLTDEDKLEYIFDDFNTDYIINFESDGFSDDELQIMHDLGLKEESVDFNVIITDTHLIISCDKSKTTNKSINMMDSVINDFIMDGMILMLQSFNKDDTKRVYKLIGKCDAYSLN